MTNKKLMKMFIRWFADVGSILTTISLLSPTLRAKMKDYRGNTNLKTILSSASTLGVEIKVKEVAK